MKPVIYENGVQELLLTDAGHVTLSDKKYHYYLQDHQENNRVVVDQTGQKEEVGHYYHIMIRRDKTGPLSLMPSSRWLLRCGMALNLSFPR